jgi:hypothetical protein
MRPSARRSVRTAPAIAATALIAGALFATPAAALSPQPDPTPAETPAATTAPPQADGSGVSLTVAPASDGVVPRGSDLVLTVEIRNSGQTSLAAGTVEVQIGDTAIDTSAALGAWFDAADPGAGASLDAAGSAPSTPIGQGAAHVVQVTVPAAQLGDDGGGVYPVVASLQSAEGETVVASGRTSVVVGDLAALSSDPAGLTVVAPITSVASSTGLIQRAALEAFTADTGVLTRELDAVAGRPVTIAVDPRIIVSIRALGSTAPDSAVAWLERLESAPNPIIPLTYGDSDISGERQAGADALLAPTSFSYALDPADFTDVDVLIEPTASATPGPTVAPGASSSPTAVPGTDGDAEPEPTPAAPAVPSTEQLLDWDYTATGIAWPRAATVVAADLPAFAAAGYDTTLLDSSQVVGADGTAAATATGTVGGQKVLVADHQVSAALQEVLSATAEPARADASSRLSSALVLAADAAEDGRATSGSGTVLAVLDRTVMNLQSIDEALSVAAATGVVRPQPLGALLADGFAAPLSITDSPQAEERIQQIATLLADGRSLDAFSTVLADPQLLAGRQRADLLALLSNTWTTNPGGWNVAVEASRAETAGTLGAVQVVDGSSINMVANQANLPVTVSNELPYPVTVVLHVTPSNGRLVVEKSDVEVTIEASSRKGAQIPLEAGVANGRVLLNMQVLSPAGVLVSVPSPVLVNVSADWETWGTVIGAVLVVAVFGAGIVRSILRRRRQRRMPGADEPAGAREGGAGEQL